MLECRWLTRRGCWWGGSGVRRGRPCRYLAHATGGKIVVPEPMVVFTVKAPAALADRVRERARVSGGTVSAVVAAALAEPLARGRGRSGGRRPDGESRPSSFSTVTWPRMCRWPTSVWDHITARWPTRS